MNEIQPPDGRADGSPSDGQAAEAPDQAAEAPDQGPEDQGPEEQAPKPAAPQYQVAMETVERFGRQFRHLPVAVSAEAMALSWANTEQGPAGAAMVVDHEVGARGFLGRLWKVPPSRSLILAVILRPDLPAEEGDAAWLVCGVAAAQGIEAATGKALRTWWPDRLIDPDTGGEVAMLHASIQLGPGKIKHAVITAHVDLEPLGLDADGRDGLTGAIVDATDAVVGEAERQGAGYLAEAYSARCAQVDKRVKLSLRPKGETRGVARGIDRLARLELQAASGMMERIGVDQLREITVVGG